jgi:peptidoglycan-associated lipoprotein
VSCDFQTIYFQFDQAVIAADYRDTLDKIAECVRKVPGERALSLYGHADESGTEEYNIALSERRARAVADYLARFGVDPARFYIVPKGESDSANRGPEADRRVELEWR